MNLGAILRCAYFLGVDRVITTAKKWSVSMLQLVSVLPSCRNLKCTKTVHNTIPHLTPPPHTHTHSCPLSPAVSKASSGAMELLPVFAVQDMGEFLSEASHEGWKILGTCSSIHEDELDDNKEVPVIQCSQYMVKEPTIIALGEPCYIQWNLSPEIIIG